MDDTDLSLPTVPDRWKHPEGRYQQAPEKYGGEWWLVNPFTGSAPWIRHFTPPPTTLLLPGFVELFGKRPQSSDFNQLKDGNRIFRVAVGKWEQDLRYFKQAGWPLVPANGPEGIAENDLKVVAAVCEAWEMGRPHFYEGRYGWVAVFPDAVFPGYESGLKTLMTATHLMIARFQVRQIRMGLTPTNLHPYLPPHVRKEVEDREPS